MIFGLGTSDLIILGISAIGFGCIIWTIGYVLRKAREIKTLDPSTPNSWVFSCIHIFLFMLVTSLYSAWVERTTLLTSLIGLTVYGWVPIYLVVRLKKLKTAISNQQKSDPEIVRPSFDTSILYSRSRLNGWVRAWIVFSVVWGIIVIGHTAVTTTSIASIQNYWEKKIKVEENALDLNIKTKVDAIAISHAVVFTGNWLPLYD